MGRTLRRSQIFFAFSRLTFIPRNIKYFLVEPHHFTARSVPLPAPKARARAPPPSTHATSHPPSTHPQLNLSARPLAPTQRAYPPPHTPPMAPAGSPLAQPGTRVPQHLSPQLPVSPSRRVAASPPSPPSPPPPPQRDSAAQVSGRPASTPAAYLPPFRGQPTGALGGWLPPLTAPAAGGAA